MQWVTSHQDSTNVVGVYLCQSFVHLPQAQQHGGLVKLDSSNINNNNTTSSVFYPPCVHDA